MPKQYWLMKSEPSTYSFEDLCNAPKQTDCWDGIRNYQARNFMRDVMQIGDAVLFYHSSCKVPAVMGLAEIASKPYPDHTAWDKKSSYYDPKSTQDNPRWCMVDVRYKKTFKTPVTLQAIKENTKLKDMKLVQRGQRLSIQPVTKAEYDEIVAMGK